jgi:hypothetical protein
MDIFTRIDEQRVSEFQPRFDEAEKYYSQGIFDLAVDAADQALQTAESEPDILKCRLLLICANFRRNRFDDASIHVGELKPHALKEEVVLSHEPNGRIAVIMCLCLLAASKQYSRFDILKHMTNFTESACGIFFDSDVAAIRKVGMAISDSKYSKAISILKSVQFPGISSNPIYAEALTDSLLVEYVGSFLRVKIAKISDEFQIPIPGVIDKIEQLILTNQKLGNHRIDIRNEEVHRIGLSEAEKSADAHRRRIDAAKSIMNSIETLNFMLTTASSDHLIVRKGGA